MTWNYRLIKRGELYTIHEVYGDNWTSKPCSPGGETVEEVRWSLQKMMKALESPVLVEKGNRLVEVKGDRRNTVQGQ